MTEAIESLGKVRTEQVKRIAQELIKRNPDKFSTDFENNKKLVKSLTRISSTKLRNRVAGYVTRLANIMQTAQAGEIPETAEATEASEPEETE